MLHVVVRDEQGNELTTERFPYALFSYKERWVDLVFSEPPKLGGTRSIMCLFDPEAHQTKGIYFHYNAVAGSSHSGVAKSGEPHEETPDREWMIRAYIRR
jgi:hypothetical protein